MTVFLTGSFNTLEALVSALKQGLNPWYFPRISEYSESGPPALSTQEQATDLGIFQQGVARSSHGYLA